MSLDYQSGSRRQEWRDAAVILLFVALGLSFVIYPFVAVADLMSLAGYRTGRESDSLLFASRTFLYGSLAYPIILIPCLMMGTLFAVLRKIRTSIAMFIAPLVYVALLSIAFLMWHLAAQ